MTTTNAAAPRDLTLNIESGDVVRIVQQWLRESGLKSTLKAMERETGINLTETVDDVDAFVDDCNAGRWDRVLRAVTEMRMSSGKLADLYEHITLELAEMGEKDAARVLLRDTTVMEDLRERQVERYLRLEELLNRTGPLEEHELYASTSGSRAQRRAMIAEQLSKDLSMVPASRLLTLLGMSVKWMERQGQLPADASAFDLFRGMSTATVDEGEDLAPGECFATMKFGAKSYAEAARFTPNGKYLVTGTVDGFIELWNPMTGKLATELAYQAEDNVMAMKDAVLFLAVSRDSEMLASGSQSGQIKIWRIATGKCERTFERAHSQGVTSLAFSADGTQLLSASFDQTVRIHGLNSGRMLKEFRGHTSFVNAAIYSHDASKILSCSSDGTVKIWEVRTSECIRTVRPEAAASATSVGVQQIIAIPNKPDLYLVCNKSIRGFLMNLSGKMLRTFSNPHTVTGAPRSYLCVSATAHGRYALFCREDGVLEYYRVESGRYEGNVKLHAPAEVIGITHHPSKNVFLSYADDGELRLWRP